MESSASGNIHMLLARPLNAVLRHSEQSVYWQAIEAVPGTVQG